jgi:hypothetical protein
MPGGFFASRATAAAAAAAATFTAVFAVATVTTTPSSQQLQFLDDIHMPLLKRPHARQHQTANGMRVTPITLSVVAVRLDSARSNRHLRRKAGRHSAKGVGSCRKQDARVVIIPVVVVVVVVTAVAAANV